MTSEDELRDFPANPATISLAYGGHNEGILSEAKTLLASATAHAFDVEPPDCPNLNYGDQLGSERFRTSLGSFLSHRYGREVKSDSLVLTCGATHALHLMTSQLFSTGSLVFVEEPSYYLALRLLRDDLAMQLVPVPLLEDGLALDRLEERLVTLRARSQFTPSRRRPFWSLVYIIPDHHNPTGASMPAEKRRALVSLARQFDLLVFCDDVYNLLTYAPASVGPLLITCDVPDPPAGHVVSADPPAEHRRSGHVVSAGTFSKICAPGVRVGWLEAPARVIDLLRDSNILFSGGAVNGYMSTVMASAIQLGLLDRHLDLIIGQLQEKMSGAVALLQTALPPDRYQLRAPSGGFFLWLRCPFEVTPFAAWCQRERGVAVRAGTAFSADGDGCRRHLRLSVSYLSSQLLQQALTRLCDALFTYEARQTAE